MSEYSFKEAEKVAIWKADGEKCFYCRTPVQYSELQVDHIVPETIPPNKLQELRQTLPDTFEINSILNWVTCHQRCNSRKNDSLFDTRALLYYVQMASRRASTVQKFLDDFKTKRQNGRLLSALIVRIEHGHLSLAAVESALSSVSVSSQTEAGPWIMTFGANFSDHLPRGAPNQDPELSDWLSERLDRDLQSSGAVFRRIDDNRSGETVSVRCALWLFDLDRVKQCIELHWKILGTSEIFGGLQ